MTFWFLYINCLLWSWRTRTGGDSGDFPSQSQANTRWREKKIKRNLVQSELAAPCGWINMWAGRNKKTYERQHLSVLRVNKRLCMTLLLLLGLEALSAACKCHSGNAWNRRGEIQVLPWNAIWFHQLCSLWQSLLKSTSSPPPEVHVLHLHIPNVTQWVFNPSTKTPITIAPAWLVSVCANFHLLQTWNEVKC